MKKNNFIFWALCLWPTLGFSYSAAKIEELIRKLDHPNLLEQSEASFLLESMGQKADPHLLKYIDSPSLKQRQRVLHILAKHRRKEAIPAIRREIEKDPCSPNLYSLGWVGDAKEVPFILNSRTCGAEDGYPEAAPLLLIAKRDLKAFLKGVYTHDPYLEGPSSILKELRLATPVILNLFQDKDPVLQWGALILLRGPKEKRISLSQAEYFFSKSLDSKNPSHLFQAIKGIQEYRSTTLFKKLIQIAPRLREHSKVWEAFLRLDPWLLHPSLRRQFTREALRRHLGKTVDDENEVTRYLDHPDLGKIALVSLTDMNSAKALELIKQKLKDPSTKNPCYLLSILDRIKAIPLEENLLLHYLTHPDEVCQYYALRGVIQRDFVPLERLLGLFADGKNISAKTLILQEMGRRHSQKSTPFLIDYLLYLVRVNDVGLAKIAIEALASIEDPLAISPLKLISETSQNKDIRREAGLALKKITEQ